MEEASTSAPAAAAVPLAVWAACLVAVVAEEVDHPVASPSKDLAIVDLTSRDHIHQNPTSSESLQKTSPRLACEHIARSLIRVYTLWHGTFDISSI